MKPYLEPPELVMVRVNAHDEVIVIEWGEPSPGTVAGSAAQPEMVNVVAGALTSATEIVIG